MTLNVVEKFVSINGEGKLSGQLSVFIRFKGCNLSCSYCDTAWANEDNTISIPMEPQEIYNYIKSTGVRNITLTGGEPLLQEGIIDLLRLLSTDKELRVEIETNGSVPLDEFRKIENPPSFTMDYKLPMSSMEDKMCLDNLHLLTNNDVLKFVCSSLSDLVKAKNIIESYKLIDRTNIYLSPTYGNIDLNTIVEFMKSNMMNGVNLQLQLHKIIWDPNKRGV